MYGPSRVFTRMFALGLREGLREHGVSVKRTAIEHRFLPETYKAARHATKAKPRPQRS
ncbi:hypothetical protein [Streptomyces sp. A244]|uniref:hypothetical protein n=1 Tax=Streptomyces sp. A244 TaxID=2137016 RepID=UPI00215995DE|nr:hypothetical protein [Streptomyces sp. A244]